MTRANKKNTRIGLVVAGVLAVTGAVAWVSRDLWLRSSREISCDDGKRRLIDAREFTTRYWAYSFELEASLAAKGKITAKLDPERLQQLSEAMQEGREFRHFLVAGYNSCAIPKSRYAQYGARFQALDSVARRIDAAANQASAAGLEDLVRQYISLSQALADQR